MTLIGREMAVIGLVCAPASGSIQREWEAQPVADVEVTGTVAAGTSTTV
jgi:hypothetical protein